jgi:chemotaxis protein histidine kinase CheA
LGETVLDAANQQRILGYFIEEAKEHLETLEQGILDLSSVIKDSERVNEMFRAAHSVKGGAAMLGYGSIQKTAHRLEDAFKILKENEVAVDQRLESLFLGGYDVLQDLIEQLQGPFGLREEEAAEVIQRTESTFVELQDYLNQLVSHGTVVPRPEPEIILQPVHNPPTPSVALSGQVKALLKQMLNLFRQPANPETRQQLQKICTQLEQLAPGEKGWQELLKAAKTAIANPKHSFATLAPVVIKEIKSGWDLLEMGQSNPLSLSPTLQSLATAQLPQILITVDPNSVAQTLLKVFNQQQVSQIIQILQTSH